MKSVKVDQDACIGCSSCSVICGSVFAMKEAKAVVISSPDKEEEDKVRVAKEACPTQAISVED